MTGFPNKLPTLIVLLALVALAGGLAIPRAQAQSVQPLAGASTGSVGASSLSNASTGLPRVFAPTQPRAGYARYPWKLGIVTTIFWIGEQPTARNPTPNHKSSWDSQWAVNYGGYDDPDPGQRATDFTPKGFTPGQNPFYVALPYNDLVNWRMTKPTAKRIPWFPQRYERPGKSVCKGRWIAIRYGSKVCYAQWEDCGPFETDDHDYVFGSARPRNPHNGGAGLDVSPAVRDYLGLKSGARCDWRFVDLAEIPGGPWCRFGANNHFVQMQDQEKTAARAELEKLRLMRDAWLKDQKLPGSYSN